MRVVCQFSCGTASAVATKLAIAQYGATHDVLILNAQIEDEHPDNRRFARECEQWFGIPLTVARDEKYGASVDEVNRQRRYTNGQHGAPCSTYLKRKVLDPFKRPGDIVVFGFTVEEADRLFDRQQAMPDVVVESPLIRAGLTKSDCRAMVLRAGIELPYMSRHGYNNDNCIGCWKGGEGYWAAIREDFPDVFEARARRQDDIGPGSYIFRNRSTGERYSLRNIPITVVARRNEALPSCSFFCEAAEREYASVDGSET